MKKAIRAISILLILAMLLSTAALAIDDPEWGVEGGLVIKDLKVETGYTLTVLEMLDKDDYGPVEGVEGKYAPVEPGFKLSYTCTDPTQEFVYLYKGDSPTEETLYWLDQKSGESTTEFVLWPKTMDEGSYTIKRSNNSGVTAATVATFTVGSSKPEYTLGDVHIDGVINPLDALDTLRIYVGDTELEITEVKRKAADVDCNGTVNPLDALNILRLYVGDIKSFDEIKVK